MPDTTVKYFDSTMSGAPSLSGETGKLIGILDACLMNGFGSVTLDSLVVASNVVTGSISTGHNLAMVGDTGPVIKIEGATPAGLNGEWRLASVPTANTFTFATSGISDQTATGTITAKRAPAGFSKAFSGTNKAAYRADDIAGTRLYLRVDDTGTTSARVIGYETMSDVDTGTGPFPTNAQYSGGTYYPKSSAASATARAWRIVADSQGFFISVQQDGTYWAANAFIDLLSEKAADAFHALLVGGITTTVANMGNLFSTTTSASSSGHFIARSHTQLGSSILAIKKSHSLSINGLGYAGSAYPSAVGNQFYCAPVEVWESATIFRGVLPGVYDPIHAANNLTDGTIESNISGLAGRDVLTQLLQSGGTNYAVAFDITGPWR